MKLENILSQLLEANNQVHSLIAATRKQKQESDRLLQQLAQKDHNLKELQNSVSHLERELEKQRGRQIVRSTQADLERDQIKYTETELSTLVEVLNKPYKDSLEFRQRVEKHHMGPLDSANELHEPESSPKSLLKNLNQQYHIRTDKLLAKQQELKAIKKAITDPAASLTELSEITNIHRTSDAGVSKRARGGDVRPSYETTDALIARLQGPNHRVLPRETGRLFLELRSLDHTVKQLDTEIALYRSALLKTDKHHSMAGFKNALHTDLNEQGMPNLHKDVNVLDLTSQQDPQTKRPRHH